MAKRELIDTGTDKRYVRRNKLGTSFVELTMLGRSLAADRRKRAKTKVKSGEGDKGDRPRPKTQNPAKPPRKSPLAGKEPLGKSARRKPRARSNAALPDFIPVRDLPPGRWPAERPGLGPRDQAGWLAPSDSA